VTPAQIELVQSSFAGAGTSPVLADRFYEEFFGRDPAARRLFTTDLAAQRQKFVEQLRTIVEAVSDLDSFVGETTRLGARHAEYGARPSHYRDAGEALLTALAEALGEDWTDEHRAAWAQAYDLIAETMMIGGARAGG
jgi:hemoglobin-like flavoprotein